jgi:hypothetical protein
MSAAFRSSGNPPPGTRTRWFDKPSINELPDRRHRYANMAANAHKTDATLGDEATGKPISGAQQLGDLSNGQEPLHLGCRRLGHHAALPVAETSAAFSIRCLASSSAVFNRVRSATMYNSRVSGDK